VLQILVLSGTPRQFLAWIACSAVRAGFNSICHTVAEHASNGRQGWEPALILNGIVQQGSDSLILITASVNDQPRTRSSGEKCREWGRPFVVVDDAAPGGELQSKVKSPRQERGVRFSFLLLTHADSDCRAATCSLFLMPPRERSHPQKSRSQSALLHNCSPSKLQHHNRTLALSVVHRR
jgi:hypothetical protein